VFSVLELANALKLHINGDLDDDSDCAPYIEFNQQRAKRLGIQASDTTLNCIGSITNLPVKLQEKEDSHIDEEEEEGPYQPEEDEDEEKRKEDPHTDTAIDLEVGLFEAYTNQLIATLEDGAEVSANDIANRKITISASILEDSCFSSDDGEEVNVTSIFLNLNGQYKKTERASPYSLFGDLGGTLKSHKTKDNILKDGANTITFKLFYGKNRDKKLLGTVTRHFTVVDSLSVKPNVVKPTKHSRKRR
jgi:hypothetical protein